MFNLDIQSQEELLELQLAVEHRKITMRDKLMQAQETYIHGEKEDIAKRLNTLIQLSMRLGRSFPSR